MSPVATTQMKELLRYIRNARKSVSLAGIDDPLQTRALFLKALAAHALERLLLARRDLYAEDARLSLSRICGGASDEIFATSGIPFVSEVQEIVTEDVLMVGWAYQFWNEAERDVSTWAISRRGDQRTQRQSISAATQIFTEDYMAHFVVRRLLKLVGGDDTSLTVFDPACGAGHLLVHSLRQLSARSTRTEPIESCVARLYGADVDGSVVELCRIILFLEAIRLGATDTGAVVDSLERTIVPLSCEHGALRRDVQNEVCARRYSCVITNPPYVGRRKLPEESRAFLDKEYPDSSMDLCAAFMQRCVEFVKPGGFLGLVTVDKWLRLKGYEHLRYGGSSFKGLYKTLSLDVVCELGQRAFSQVAGLHDGVGISLLTARVLPPHEEHVFHFVSLTDARSSHEKARLLEEWRTSSGDAPGSRKQDELLRARSGDHFLIASGIPHALTMPDTATVRDRVHVVVGLQTSDDRAFVRYVWNVPPDKKRWKVHSKGGGYGRWFGLNRFLIDWSRGRPIFEKNPKSGLSVERWFEHEGWTYTWFANGSLGVRFNECGWSFGRAAASGIFCDDPRIIAFLNSRVASLAARRIGGKAQLPEGVVRKIPLPESLESIDASLVSAAVAIKRRLVSRDLTDVSFMPGQSWNSVPVLYLEALLLVVEGMLERQVLDSLPATESERSALDVSMGRPVAWFPRRHFDDDHFWSAIPEEFRSLRKKVQMESSGHEAPDFTGGVAALEEVFKRQGLSSGRHVGFPISSNVEGMCRSCGLHPSDVADYVASRVNEDMRIRQTILTPSANAKIGEEVLRALGHQWWSGDDEYSPRQHRRFSHAELVDHLSSLEVCREIESLLGMSIDRWLYAKLPTWLSRTFYKSGPIDIVEHGTRNYVHRWADSEVVGEETMRVASL